MFSYTTVGRQVSNQKCSSNLFGVSHHTEGSLLCVGPPNRVVTSLYFDKVMKARRMAGDFFLFILQSNVKKLF